MQLMVLTINKKDYEYYNVIQSRKLLFVLFLSVLKVCSKYVIILVLNNIMFVFKNDGCYFLK